MVHWFGGSFHEIDTFLHSDNTRATWQLLFIPLILAHYLEYVELVDIKLPDLAFQFIIKFCAACIYMAK